MVPVQQVFIGFIVFRPDKVPLIKGLLHELFPNIWCGKGILCSIRLIKGTKSASGILLEFGMIAENADEYFSVGDQEVNFPTRSHRGEFFRG